MPSIRRNNAHGFLAVFMLMWDVALAVQRPRSRK
jgi:hypothetical protein